MPLGMNTIQITRHVLSRCAMRRRLDKSVKTRHETDRI